MLLEAVAGLQDRRGGELAVDAENPRVRAVVEAAVDADGAVDPVDHPHALAGKASQSPKLEVERVEQTRARLAGEAVDLDLETAASPLLHEGQQELVAAAVGRRVEFVEDGKIRVTAARAEPVGLRPTGVDEGPDGSCKGPVRHAGPILKPFGTSG